MAGAHEAKLDLGGWFAKMLEELDEDSVEDPAVIADLKDRVAEAFAEWRVAHGIGLQGPGT